MLQKDAKRVPLLEACWNQCRWPLWQQASDPQLVCGAPVTRGKSYCCEHMGRLFKTSDPRRLPRMRIT